MLARMIAIPVFAVLTGCGHATDSKLVGWWRWKDCDDAGDVVYRADHTFTSRQWGVTYIHQPPMLVDAGEWHVRGDRLVLDSKRDTLPPEARHIELPFSFFGPETLLVRATDGRLSTFERVK
jgi:hypothetical protein